MEPMTKSETITNLEKMRMRVDSLKKTPGITRLLAGLKNKRNYLLSPHGTELLAKKFWREAAAKYKFITGEEFKIAS